MSYKSEKGTITHVPQVLERVRTASDKEFWDKKNRLLESLAFDRADMNPNNVKQGDVVEVLETGFGKKFNTGDVFVPVSLVDGRAYRGDGEALPLSCLRPLNGIQKVEKKRDRKDKTTRGIRSQMVGDLSCYGSASTEIDFHTSVL